MAEAAAPGTLPGWRRNHRATSPDGRLVATIDPAWEVAMGAPTSGMLCVSCSFHVERCNPAFRWSEDSRYLAVPQFFLRLGLFWRQRVLVIDFAEKRVYQSLRTAGCVQVESFSGGRLVATAEPHRSRQSVAYDIPGDIGTAFRRDPTVPWPELPPA